MPALDFNRDLSTGEVAVCLRCSIQTVIKVFESKELPGYKVGKANKFRRFTREAVQDFMTRHRIPETERARKILGIDASNRS